MPEGSNISAMQDSYYKTLTPDQHARAHSNEYDFDCPDALDFDALVQTLRDLKQGYINHPCSNQLCDDLSLGY